MDDVGWRPRVGQGKEPVMKRAFTLVELLVVVGVIGILITILLPVVLRSKRHAEAAAGTANLRSLSQIMSMYTTDNQEAFLNPFGTGPGNFMLATSPLQPELKWNFANPVFPPNHTEAFAYYWYSYLSELDQAPRFREEQFSPADAWMKELQKGMGKRGETREGLMLWPSSFLYSPVFYSSGERFPGGQRLDATAGNIRSQYAQNVAYPSGKVMLFERMDFDQRDRVTVDEATGTSTRIGRPPSWNNIRSHTAVATVDGGIQEVDISELYASDDPNLVPADLVASSDRPGLVHPFDQPELPAGAGAGTDGAYPAFFWSTIHGLEGRDLPH